MPDPATSQTIHATAVAFDQAGLIITGRSGAGKSSLALQLIALGAALISDDRVIATVREGDLWLEAPDTIRNRIEARGLGILNCSSVSARACAVVTLDQTEEERLPEQRETVIAGVQLPLLHKVESPAFPAMLKLYLTGGPHGHPARD